jgi:hypothetical protein
MFQKFNSPNKLKYLTDDFNKVSTHPKQQLLLKTFFYKFKTGRSQPQESLGAHFAFNLVNLVCVHPSYTIVQQDTLAHISGQSSGRGSGPGYPWTGVSCTSIVNSTIVLFGYV